MPIKNNIFIDCRLVNPDILSFYLNVGNKRYFMFYQKMNEAVYNLFYNGVNINKLKHVRDNTPINKLIDKLPSYIKYMEDEYELKVLNKNNHNYLYKKNKYSYVSY